MNWRSREYEYILFFLPYLRTGLAAKLQESDLSSKRACLDFSLNIKANKIDGSSEEKELTKRIHLYGPGDITGFEKTIVVAHDPADQTGDFEPNYFPAIQFRDPDFLWRYNANVADENNKLHPWLTLVVLIAEDKGDIHREFVVPDKSESIRRAEKKLPPYIENVNVATLPDLNESWRWAHVQVTGSRTTFEGNLNENLTDIYRNYPERLACRLLCARRLRPGTLYNAFVVPTFKLGLVAAGLLDSTGDMTASTLAWSTGTEESMRLPYYYKWEFRTGQSGDFEHLVRRLEPRQLTQVGLREMDCSNLGWEIPSVDEDGILELEGALKTVNTMSSFWGLDRPDLSQLEATRCQLAELLNRNSGITNKTVFFIPDTETPFFIKEAEVTVVKNEALVSWKTDIETTSKVEYGRINLNQSVQSNVFEKDHSVLIDNLMSNTVYRLRIVATTQNGLSAVSQVVELRSGDDKPFVLPPIYGRWHAGRDRVDCEEKGSWFDELNLDPRHRAAAGVGAEVIRQKQEPLMASAWEQVGEVRKANELLNRTHVGVEVSKNVFQRFNDLSLDNFLTLSRPLHGRIKTRTGGKTISGLLGASRIPNEALNYSLRRLCRPFGPIRKRQMMAKNITVLSTNTPFLKRFNGESVSTRTEDIFTAAEASINPAGTRGMISTSSTRANEQVVMPSINFGGKTLIDQYTQLKQNNSSIKLTKTDRNIALAFTPVLQSIQNQQKNFNNQKTSAPYLDLNVLREQLIMKLNPQETLARKFCKRVKMPSKALETELPDNIMVAPKFSQPMYEALFEISKEWLIPGIENIPPNTVSFLKRISVLLKHIYVAVIMSLLPNYYGENIQQTSGVPILIGSGKQHLIRMYLSKNIMDKKILLALVRNPKSKRRGILTKFLSNKQTFSLSTNGMIISVLDIITAKTAIPAQKSWFCSFEEIS